MYIEQNPSKSSLELERHIFAVYLLGLKGIGRGAARRLKMMNASTEASRHLYGLPTSTRSETVELAEWWLACLR
ncbi:hypothetical protein K525DRAFT_275133 [Schizophyllum commune Loenen D]|nr:hypothetical protein K525DRAFT_275133 [Schizophyllum commune Loenen D]